MTKLYKLHHKRMKLVLFIVLLFISLSTVKTLYLQLFKDPSQSINQNKIVKGERGVIVDRNGIKLAYDVDVCDLYLEKIDQSQLASIEYFMEKHFNLNISLDSLFSSSNKGQFNLIESIPYDDIIELEYILKDYPEIKKTIKYKGRYYPKKELASQLIGKFSDKNNIKGLWGIERSMDDVLQPKKDSLEYLVTSRGRTKKNFSNDQYDKLSGQDVMLTIDSEYQKILEQELSKQLKKTGSEKANGIIVNPYNGEILALATVPSFNLNQNFRDDEQYRDYVSFYNYEPGSTLKAFSILAGIKNEKILLSDEYYCEKGKYYMPDIRRTIVDHDPYDTLSVKEILAYSSNIGMTKIASDIGKTDIYKMFKSIGFGQKTGLNSYNEEAGNLKKIESWDKHSLISISIGQELQVTNLQIAMAYSAIANGGYLLKPQIIKEVSNAEIDSVSIIRKIANQDHLDLLIDALKMAVSDGTASSLADDDFCSYGKTGTAQVFENESNQYSDTTFISSYVSIFPCETPEIVCVVSFFAPDLQYKWASQTAVPAVKNILNEVLIKDKSLSMEITDEIK